MRCDISIELLSAYLDQELSETDRRQVEEHLKICAACQTELAEMKFGDELVRQRPVPEPSGKIMLGFETRLLNQIRPRSRWSWLWRVIPIATPVAAAAVTVLVVLVNQEKTTPMVGLPEIVPLVISRAEEREDKDIDRATGHMKRADVPAPAPARSVEKKETEVMPASKAAAPVLEPTGGLLSPPAAAVTAGAGDEVTDDDAYQKEVTRIQAAITELNIPRNKVVRAMVDSTGRIVRVATGNSIQPEEDTALVEQLAGQQIAPRSFTRKQNLRYLDLTQPVPADTIKSETQKSDK